MLEVAGLVTGARVAGMFRRAAKRSRCWLARLGSWLIAGEVGGAFGDHDGRRVGVAADDRGITEASTRNPSGADPRSQSTTA